MKRLKKTLTVIFILLMMLTTTAFCNDESEGPKVKKPTTNTNTCITILE